jgi:hypothetical protein
VARRPAGHSGTEDDEAYAARVRAFNVRSCAEQGLPLKVRDPAVLGKVAELLSQARQKTVKRDSSNRL